MSLRQGEWAVAALFAAYALLYWSHVIGLDLPVAAQFSYFAGSGSMICMALGMLLSARPRVVETSFGGLDRMYRLHKHLGVAALILFLAHFVTIPGEAEAVTAAEEEGLLSAQVCAVSAVRPLPCGGLSDRDRGGRGGLPVSGARPDGADRGPLASGRRRGGPEAAGAASERRLRRVLGLPRGARVRAEPRPAVRRRDATAVQRAPRTPVPETPPAGQVALVMPFPATATPGGRRRKRATPPSAQRRSSAESIGYTSAQRNRRGNPEDRRSR